LAKVAKLRNDGKIKNLRFTKGWKMSDSESLEALSSIQTTLEDRLLEIEKSIGYNQYDDGDLRKVVETGLTSVAEALETGFDKMSSEIEKTKYDDEELVDTLGKKLEEVADDLSDIRQRLDKNSRKRNRRETYLIHPSGLNAKVFSPKDSQFESEKPGDLTDLPTTLTWFTQRGGTIIPASDRVLYVTLPIKKKKKE